MFRIVVIPFDCRKEIFDEDILNRAIINKHVKAYQASFFQCGGKRYWSVFIEYDPVIEPSRPDESEGLDEAQQLLLSRLKAWRKQRAEQDGLPVFIIATNKELVDIVRNAPATLEALKDIRGFGKGKAGKYGGDITNLIRAFFEIS
jgi:superfamily II DNA helicase RecQ